MKFEEIAAQRRSIRKFEDRRVEKEIIDQILRVALTAPSSKNSRTTRIAVTEDKKLLEAIGRMRSMGSSFVKDAPLAFIVMGDDTATDLWRENAAISATLLQLAAESLGLGTCWVHVNGRPHDENDPKGQSATEYLHQVMPSLGNARILCVVAAGYPEIRHRPHDMQIDPEKVIYLDK